jgi:DNA-binding NtrC family response regulator
MSALVNHNWNGNVRELENAVERAFIFANDELDLESLPAKIRSQVAGPNSAIAGDDSRMTLEAIERRHVLGVLNSVGQDKVSASKILGIDLSTLYRKLKRYDEM